MKKILSLIFIIGLLSCSSIYASPQTFIVTVDSLGHVTLQIPISFPHGVVISATNIDDAKIVTTNEVVTTNGITGKNQFPISTASGFIWSYPSNISLMPNLSGPHWDDIGQSNTIVLWSSNSIPPTLYSSYFDVNSNRIDIEK